MIWWIITLILSSWRLMATINITYLLIMNLSMNNNIFLITAINHFLVLITAWSSIATQPTEVPTRPFYHEQIRPCISRVWLVNIFVFIRLSLKELFWIRLIPFNHVGIKIIPLSGCLNLSNFTERNLTLIHSLLDS